MNDDRERQEKRQFISCLSRNRKREKERRAERRQKAADGKDEEWRIGSENREIKSIAEHEAKMNRDESTTADSARGKRMSIAFEKHFFAL